MTDRSGTQYSSLSLWLDGLHETLTPRPGLSGDVDVDVAIVGGGYSGLWTAYYLLQNDPSIRVCIVERDICGFGASGRNGGWCVGELAASVETYAKHGSHDSAVSLLRHAFDAVDEVGRVVAKEAIDCDFVKGGNIRWARSGPQDRRIRNEIDEMRALGVGPDVMRLLDADEACAIGNASNVRSGIFFAPCAALDPAKLVRGLAALVESLGCRIHEQTAALEIADGKVVTASGTVTASHVIRATEAYTRDLAGERRTLLPLYSLMVATEPLDEAVFDEIGLTNRPTFADDRYTVIYGQRSADNRIAFGGRGAPYMFGSRIDRATERDSRAHELIVDALVDLFPVLADVQITHRWGGVLGAPRDWTPAVRYDATTGSGYLGGYVGEGVAAANLAARTMADLIAHEVTDLTRLPWTQVRWRRWEPEPLRWTGVRLSRWLMKKADEAESQADKDSRAAIRVSRLLR